MNAIMKAAAGVAAGAALLAAGPAAADFVILQDFETTAVSAVPGASNGYVLLNGDLDGWMYDNAGLIDGSDPSGYGLGAPTDPGQYAFIRGEGSISYTFTAPSLGRYSHIYFTLGRGSDRPDGPILDFIVQGPDLDFAKTYYRSGAGEKAHAGTFTGGNTYTVTFQGRDPSGGSVFLDALYLYAGASPEPGTWALMLIGFGATGVALRRSRAQAA